MAQAGTRRLVVEAAAGTQTPGHSGQWGGDWARSHWAPNHFYSFWGPPEAWGVPYIGWGVPYVPYRYYGDWSALWYPYTEWRQRWDVINFIRARAAGVRAGQIGPDLTTGAAPEIPDFAFETGRTQGTLRQTLENGPVLLVLFTAPAPVERLRQLAAAQSSLDAAGLRVIAVGLGASSEEIGQGAGSPRFVVTVSSEVSAALALFRAPDDGGDTELMLDRRGAVSARWTSKTPGGLAPPAVLIADAERVGRSTVAAPSHAGHTR